MTLHSPPAPPRILLADCDAMFCAVARLVDPDGAGTARYLIVGGAANSRGVVCSASYESRAFGVRSGMSIAEAVRLCPAAMCVSVPRRACGEKSREVAAVLREWAPVVEPASIDEFYLSLEGTEALYRHEGLDVTAGRIRNDVHARTGLTLSIGGGTNRLVAKLAAERAKPTGTTPRSGVWIVTPGHEGAFLATLKVAAIPGVGPRMQERFRAVGVESVVEALLIGRSVLTGWFGPRTGEWLYDRLRGRASAEVQPRDEAKSVSREETFSSDLSEDDALDTELLRLCTTLGRDLRRSGLGARTVTLKLRDFDFRTRQASRTLAGPIATERSLFSVAQSLMHRLRRERRVPVRLLGVGATSLVAGGASTQLGLFAEEDAETVRDKALAAVQDRITTRFGDGAIGPGRLVSREEPPPS